MSGRTILNLESPVTQKTDAVAALAAYLGKEISREGVLDLGSLKLVKSNKGDAFYGVTATKCSCPAATYHSGPCKHQRKYFSVAKVEQPTASEPLVKRGGFKPFDEMPGERRAKAKASSLSAIDCHDTRDIDAAYYSIKEDREFWPCEA
jgi:hypothetical protein